MESAEPHLPPPPSSSFVEAAPATATQFPMIIEDPMSSLWNFADLLDFTADDQFSIPSWDPAPLPDPATAPSDPDLGPDLSPEKIRKRDPRLVCSNFLAGQVPCACPELDEKLEAQGLPGKKRTRTAAVVRCQVPECKADIRELKGYHRRHRVCLRCANSSAVVVDGETKRYCQQCGKFHILSDFDEGKRSCRRKLERHNNRRRRKPADSGGIIEKEESQRDVKPEDTAYDDDGGKDVLCSTSQLDDKETAQEPEDGHISPLSSNPESQMNHIDSVAAFAASHETQMGAVKDDSKCSPSPTTYCDNRNNTYSSMCPTGRISFKLYDWNPAEFPRCLRLQVLQWLSSMPIELEGYIRPGCTILTVFTAMPNFMWVKLLEDPISSIHDLVAQPRSTLRGRAPFYLYLNNTVFRVMKGGTSIVRLNMEQQAPKLHYIYPACFEAGKPIEFVACGSNLQQSKSRFFISFAGKYLSCAYTIMHHEQATEKTNNDKTNHQLYKISVPRTEPDHFGPAFVEVENDGGLSNFIPVLVSDREVCSEMKAIQKRVVKAFSTTKNSHFSEDAYSCTSCESFTREQTDRSGLLLDISWILKEPSSENLHRHFPASQVQRFSCLLNFLMENKSTVILEKVLQVLENRMDNVGKEGKERGSFGADISLLKEQMGRAREFFHQKLQRHSRMEEGSFSVRITDQAKSEAVPLLETENGILIKKRSSHPTTFFTTKLRSRPALCVVAAAAVCFGLCSVVLHPHKVGDFAVYIHRRLFDNPYIT